MSVRLKGQSKQDFFNFLAEYYPELFQEIPGIQTLISERFFTVPKSMNKAWGHWFLTDVGASNE